MKKLFLVLTAFALSACNIGASPDSSTPSNIDDNAASASLLDQMQGTWLSDDDPKNIMVIDGNAAASIYDGDPLGVEIIAIVSDCETMQSDPAGMAFTLADDGPDKRCFTVLTVNQDTLVYSYFSRGNTLSFSKQ